MAINNKTVAVVTADVQNADTTEFSFRTGVSDLAAQTDDNQVLLATLSDRTGAIGAPVSPRLHMLNNIPDSEVDMTHNYVSTTNGVIRSADTETTLTSGFVTIFPTNTGTFTHTINVDANTPDGAAFYIASNATMTVAYTGPTGFASRGISLGSATKVASGAYDKTANVIYFSETVT